LPVPEGVLFQNLSTGNSTGADDRNIFIAFYEESIGNFVFVRDIYLA